MEFDELKSYLMGKRGAEMDFPFGFDTMVFKIMGKIFALICRDQLFIKPTNAGKAFIGDPVEAPPYPGAKMYYLIEDEIEDRDWISTLVRVSAEELPLPKPKKKKG